MYRSKRAQGREKIKEFVESGRKRVKIMAQDVPRDQWKNLYHDIYNTDRGN